MLSAWPRTFFYFVCFTLQYLPAKVKTIESCISYLRVFVQPRAVILNHWPFWTIPYLNDTNCSDLPFYRSLFDQQWHRFRGRSATADETTDHQDINHRREQGRVYHSTLGRRPDHLLRPQGVGSSWLLVGRGVGKERFPFHAQGRSCVGYDRASWKWVPEAYIFHFVKFRRFALTCSTRTIVSCWNNRCNTIYSVQSRGDLWIILLQADFENRRTHLFTNTWVSRGW